MDTAKELRLSTQIYLLLIGLTLVSVLVSAFGHTGRIATIMVALGIAWAKAGLIGYHYMHLKNERMLIWSVLLIAIVAVAILAVGILPDLALYPQ